MNLFVLLMFLLMVAINWMLIYSKTQFNPNDTNRKYINIKNRSLAKLLIQQKSDYVKYVKVKDRLKLNIPCFIGYIVLVIIVIIAIIMYLIPEIPCEPTSLPFSRFNSIILDTYNAKIPYTLAFIMAFVQFDIMLVSANIKMFKKEKENTTKSSKIGFSILTSGFLLFTVYLTYALIK